MLIVSVEGLLFCLALLDFMDDMDNALDKEDPMFVKEFFRFRAFQKSLEAELRELLILVFWGSSFRLRSRFRRVVTSISSIILVLTVSLVYGIGYGR